jgi:membrane-associated phospholipid phosphatase
LETRLLLWIHGFASPALDSLFLLSNALGLFPPCATLVLGVALWHVRRGERRAAGVWIATGLAAWLLPEAIKPLVARPRPELWPRLVRVTSYAFPSGHAAAGAALFPLLGFDLRRTKGRAGVGIVVGSLVAAFVGVGRVYLGVHWPTDVLAGWALGALLSAVAISRLDRPSPRAPGKGPWSPPPSG